MRKLFLYIFAFLALMLVDYTSKTFVYHNIPEMSWLVPIYPFGGYGVFQNLFGINFAICHVQNSGCAWGMLSEYTQLLFFTRLVLVGALLLYTLFFNKEKNKTFPLFLIITGALGNIIDFFLYGQVIDMLYFYTRSYSFPVFNIADSLISIGIFLLLLQSLLHYRHKKKLPI